MGVAQGDYKARSKMQRTSLGPSGFQVGFFLSIKVNPEDISVCVTTPDAWSLEWVAVLNVENSVYKDSQ